MIDKMNTPRKESTTNTWLTPKWLLDLLGKFDLDPCAAPDPRPWDCAKLNISRPADGLAHEWHGRVWLNPPYGKEIVPFMRRMSEHKRGLALIFARTDSSWYHDTVLEKAQLLFFFRGRIKFAYPDGSPAKSTANAPSVLIAYDYDEFSTLKKLEEKGLGKIAILGN